MLYLMMAKEVETCSWNSITRVNVFVTHEFLYFAGALPDNIGVHRANVLKVRYEIFEIIYG